jgi:hypothetical protein
MIFGVDNFQSPMFDNLNPYTAQSVTEAGDGANQLASWILYTQDNATYYWTLTNATTTRTVNIYLDSQHTVLLATGSRVNDGVIFFQPYTDHFQISGQVTVTYSADDVGVANTIRNTNLNAQRSLGLYGETEFVWGHSHRGIMEKFTVNESVETINQKISGAGGIITDQFSLTTAQITTLNSVPVTLLAAPGAGYCYELISCFISYTRATADITGNLTPDLIDATTTDILMNATNAFSGASSKITRFIEVAGLIAEDEAIAIKMHTGDPTMTTSTGTATVTIAYKIITL